MSDGDWCIRSLIQLMAVLCSRWSIVVQQGCNPTPNPITLVDYEFSILRQNMYSAALVKFLAIQIVFSLPGSLTSVSARAAPGILAASLELQPSGILGGISFLETGCSINKVS
ncbi:unnamed protein product [Hymenolepis diminuta]|uniref:Uncharacterized protein n=1 Tax=Hymenolepis diminuta TaxID=6216 RepID=A0A564YWH6_HYMDI|nr:unnamed protein product [Hymenolepis diminuta]